MIFLAVCYIKFNDEINALIKKGRNRIQWENLESEIVEPSSARFATDVFF